MQQTTLAVTDINNLTHEVLLLNIQLNVYFYRSRKVESVRIPSVISTLFHPHFPKVCCSSTWEKEFDDVSKGCIRKCATSYEDREWTSGHHNHAIMQLR